ncbi:hypothetical protein G9A89_005065 [Geosiphon pyriformis]|nr:hypothetical protein G9A89_005065 [Geosiphon pyriformis]
MKKTVNDSGFGVSFRPVLPRKKKKDRILEDGSNAIFTSDLDLIKATEKTISTKIIVNTNLKKSIGHSDQAVVLKKIPVGTPTEAVHAAVAEFGVVKSIKIQLLGLWQKAIIKFEEQNQTDLLVTK